ncbi:MAG TPA: PKD domain-containing protein [Candidatus Limnocylindria bacterium]|nr:PKD domain-containing protein [Candidatus Limnocylindria bacterium]
MSASRARRASLALIVSVSLVTGLTPGVAAAASTPMPTSIAAVGDSITQAASSAGSLGADAPQNSWSTGTSTSVNSHYLHLLSLGADIGGRSFNRSVSGARMVDLNAQMLALDSINPDYLTVLIGGNDLCTDTVAGMTSVTAFHDQFQQAMTTLRTVSPDTHVFVVSVPNVYQLWQLFKGNFWARFVWSVAGICQSLLANPTSTQSVDVQRRETVRQRNMAFNAQLAQVCAGFDHCLFDGNAVFNTPFAAGDVSGDYFHPSVAGQAKLASVTWAAGYEWTTSPPPPPVNDAPVAAFTPACAELSCSFTNTSSTDATSFTWTFGDGSGSTATSPSHTYAAPGTYAVTLEVADPEGLTNSVSHDVTVTATPPTTTTMSIASFTADGGSTGKNTWSATGAVVIDDSNGRPVDGATVSVAWISGSATCTTTANGTCSVTTGNFNARKVASAELTVTSVAAAGFTWDGVAARATATRP